MSASDEEMEKPFVIERAKTSRAKCKKCKLPIEKNTVRIAKLMPNPFSDGKMKAWHHVDCLFDVFGKQRVNTKKIDDPKEDIDGWHELVDEDRDIVLEKLQEVNDKGPLEKKRPLSPARDSRVKKMAKKSEASKILLHQDNNTFREFRRICGKISEASAYTEKTAIVRRTLQNGSDEGGFKGDVVLWCKMLLPMASKRIYNLQSKQLIKLFARILRQDEDSMLEDLEKGDVAETISDFFETSIAIQPSGKSHLTLQEVDDFLEELAKVTREDDQVSHFKAIIHKCTGNDLKMIIRLIKHDLRINCGPKHILEAIDPNAYRAFQVSNDLSAVVLRFIDKKSSGASTSGLILTSAKGKVGLSLMTPVLPMLAEACTSIEMAMNKCPNGMLSEVKYDGERVQIHKHGQQYHYFSRALKPVVAHKVAHFHDYIPKAFPDGDDLILDSEILLIDTKTGQPLPFGSLGVHKKAEFKDANVCIFVFDCLYYNGDILINKSMKERRAILNERMTVIPNRVMLSEVKEIHTCRELAEMIAKVLKLGLEGLVLKDVNGKYEPGKRHWLKVKRDYLFGGAIADSADLVVLGAWYGTGHKGGMMSIFLMGCYDKERDKWLTVTKVHVGHDDATLIQLQDQLDMIKISKSPNLVPNWLIVNKPMIPDFVARNPKKQPVWEITGAEFTNQGVHTADSISIRFPRVTRIRDDKDWSTATSLDELRTLFKKSCDSIDFTLLLGNKHDTTNDDRKHEATIVKKEITEVDDVEHDYQENKMKINVNKIKRKKDTNEYAVNENKKIKKQKVKVKLVKMSEDEESQIKIAKKQEGAAECFYAFIKKDYIEYSADGRPLNWIEGRKPKKGLPQNAKPLSRRCSAEVMSKAVLSGVRAIVSYSVPGERRKILLRTLKTLGASLLDDFDNKSQVTHVIYDKMEISEQELRDNEAPLARHVNESWIESVVSASCNQDELPHAVTLTAITCNCSCTYL